MPHRNLICTIACTVVIGSTFSVGQNTVTTTGGSLNSVPKFTGTTTVGNSSLSDTNGCIGVNTNTPKPAGGNTSDCAKMTVVDSFDGDRDLLVLDNPSGASNAGVTTGLRFDNSSNLMGRIFAMRDDNEFVIQNLQTHSTAGITFKSGNDSVTRIGASGQDTMVLNNPSVVDGAGVTTGLRFDNNTNLMGRIFARRDNNEFVIENLQTNSTAGITFQSGGNNIARLDPSGKLVANGTVTTGGGIVFPDGSLQTKAQVVGPQGPQGPQGIPGPTGPQGPPGPGSTSAVCFSIASTSAGSCGCNVRLVSQTLLNANSGGTCTATSNTGSCSANASSNGPVSATCCVCAPN